MDWTLLISIHWPHDRFALGWQTIKATEEDDYNTITIFLLVLSLTLDFKME